MTQQFNLPPGMVDAADDAYGEAIYAGVSQSDAMTAAIKAALGWAVKEGWAKSGTAHDSTSFGWLADTIKDDTPDEFPVIIIRLEEPKP